MTGKATAGGGTLEYGLLRREGIRHLERLAGGLWTDFNVHDPGITILEQLCYAISDLGYRIGYDIPDLLSSSGGDPYEGLFQAAEILTSHPVTPLDLRKVVLDVDGVKNAWIEPVPRDRFELHYHPVQQALSIKPKPPESEEVLLKGLHRVLIETSDLAGIDGTRVRTEVVRRLRANRPLCEDFAEVRVLEAQWVQVHAGVEIGPVEDAEQVLGLIFERIADELSPPVSFSALGDLLAEGRSVDEIFEGPPLDKGFIDDEILRRASRRTRVNASDLIRAIMEVPGVRAVRRIGISSGEERHDWSLPVESLSVPRLDLRGSEIRLEKAGLSAGVDVENVIAAYTDRRRKSAVVPRSPDVGPIAPPSGRDRSVAEYYSVQHQFPAAYGIGELGLPESATPERKAQAKQLKAYLLFFDQLLANYFAQLAHVKDLFSDEDGPVRTYFARMIDDPSLALEGVRVGEGPTHRARLDAITEDPRGDEEGAAGPSLERKNRFMNHLLARFAEEFTDYSLVLFDAMPAGGGLAVEESAGEKEVRDKQAFLRHYPRISSARGTAFDDQLAAETDCRSGLEERVRLKLGLVAELGEEFVLVEHILLRPMEGDEQQQVPLLAASPYKDPYSLQLSFVFPTTPRRFKKRGFKRFIEQLIREETPAHLTPYVHWLPDPAWQAFRIAHGEWLERRRHYWTERLGVAATPAPTPAPPQGPAPVDTENNG